MTTVKQNNNVIGELIKNQPGLVAILKPGDLIEGKVLAKNAKQLVVDLGRHGTGVVYRGELQNAKEMVRGLKVNDAVHGKVVDPDNDDGLVELSLAEAGKQKAWSMVQELQAKDEPFPVKIASFNKGGLTAELAGLTAFLPVSQLGGEHYPKVTGDDRSAIAKILEKLVGEELAVKIIDLNPRTNKLIISERAATEVSMKELAKNYAVGQEIDGIISGVADFGAFVRFTDNPQMEGLIHVSELDWKVVENPKEVVGVDEAVKAKIIEIKDGRISLSLKALKPDPWPMLVKNLKENEEITGKIHSFNPFGANVNLKNGLQGQIHVTAFGGVEEMKKALNLGKEYTFMIESVKPEERRITLKLKK